MFWKSYLHIFVAQAALVFIYIIWPMLRKFGTWALRKLDEWSPAETDDAHVRTGRGQADKVWGSYSTNFEKAFSQAQLKTRPPPPPPAPPPPAPPSPRQLYLRTLGLSGTPDRKELRLAYRRLAKTYHPDRYAAAAHSDADRARAELRMRRINEAYDWLISAEASPQSPAPR
ncbi:MAG: DnaJ domain-containing protein [Henriciella sp.]